MLQSVDTQQFAIGIYRGSQRVGRIQFEVGIRSIEGQVSYVAEEPELSRSLGRIVGKQRQWSWKELTRKLIDTLSLSTGGRFILRFGTTPSDEGRGSGEDRLRRAIDRAVNE
jgi:hypothetical protein